jgi:hypothetical protein
MKTYHIVLGFSDNNTLNYSDLFINDYKSAEQLFIKRCTEINNNVKPYGIDDYIDEGYFEYNGCVVMFIEPMNIFQKKASKKK